MKAYYDEYQGRTNNPYDTVNIAGTLQGLPAGEGSESAAKAITIKGRRSLPSFGRRLGAGGKGRHGEGGEWTGMPPRMGEGKPSTP